MYAKFEASHTTSIVHNTAETERFSFVHTAVCKKDLRLHFTISLRVFDSPRATYAHSQTREILKGRLRARDDHPTNDSFVLKF